MRSAITIHVQICVNPTFLPKTCCRKSPDTVVVVMCPRKNNEITYVRSIDPANRPINSPIVHFYVSGCRSNGFVVN
jgi:hypothetical protein